MAFHSKGLNLDLKRCHEKLTIPAGYYKEAVHPVNGFVLTFCTHSKVVLTDDPCIFSMVAVVYSPAVMRTACKRFLCSCAIHFIQPYRSRLSGAKIGLYGKANGTWVAQHAADDMSIINIPCIIAYRSPLSIIEEGNEALIGVIRVTHKLNVYNCENLVKTIPCEFACHFLRNLGATKIYSRKGCESAGYFDYNDRKSLFAVFLSTEGFQG